MDVIIERYRNKANDYNQRELFRFNAKKLQLNCTVAENGLKDLSTITVVRSGM